MIKSLSFFIIASIALTACKPNLKSPSIDTGTIDVSMFVNIGSSLEAGYADDGLTNENQTISYSNLLAEQFKLIGGNAFKQPMVSESSIGISITGKSPYKLDYKTDCKGATSLSPVRINGSGGDATIISNNVYASQGPFNNVGVPFTKLTDAITVNNNNPFFARIAKTPGTSTMISDAMTLNPTFFNLSLGLQDVLSYALGGGAYGSVTPISGISGVGFDASYNMIINTLTANGAKGVVANIPSLSSLPFFTTVAYNALVLDSIKADSLNQFYYNIDTAIVFHKGINPFVIEDASTFSGLRLAQPGELILLTIPLDSVKCYKMGTLRPIPNRHILTLSEIATIETAISNYNIIIKTIANNKGLAFVDINSFYKKLLNGIAYNSVTTNSGFVKGGAFSLDGLTLTPKGNALLANEYIKAINDKFNSTIPLVDVTKYRGVKFP